MLHAANNGPTGVPRRSIFCAIVRVVQYNCLCVGNIERLCNMLCDIKKTENILRDRHKIVPCNGYIAQCNVSVSPAVVHGSSLFLLNHKCS